MGSQTGWVRQSTKTFCQRCSSLVGISIATFCQHQACCLGISTKTFCQQSPSILNQNVNSTRVRKQISNLADDDTRWQPVYGCIIGSYIYRESPTAFSKKNAFITILVHNSNTNTLCESSTYLQYRGIH